MRLLVLENSSLKEKVTVSLEKRRQEREPEIKKVEKKTFLCGQMQRKKYAGLRNCPARGCSNAVSA